MSEHEPQKPQAPEPQKHEPLTPDHLRPGLTPGPQRPPERPQVPHRPPEPEPHNVETMRLRVAHASMQFSDSEREQRHDVQALFDRGYDWITGTESGPGSGNDLRDILPAEAKKAGYRIYLPRERTDGFVAVQESMIGGAFNGFHQPIIPASWDMNAAGQGTGGRTFGPKGVTAVSFTPENLRLAPRINVVTGHYLTRGQVPGSPMWVWNKRLAKAIGAYTARVSRGRALAFYGGDQNMRDDEDDTFFGESLTSLADELRRWQNTGHGPIDVIASEDSDARVEGVKFNVLDDKEFFLNTDHFLCEGVFEVRLLREER